MEGEYDVIIVGAGPAGLSCAAGLRGSGLSVLVLEKEGVIRDKPCAGGLSGLCPLPDLPVFKTREFSRQSFFLNNRKYTVSLQKPCKTIARSDLAQVQYEKIKDIPDITVREHTAVIAIAAGHVRTSAGDFSYRYLVGAGGVSSPVRAYLHLPVKVCAAVFCKVPVMTDEFCWTFDPPRIYSGYLWSFPHKDHTNVGVYFDPAKVKINTASRYLKEYLRSRGYSCSEGEMMHGAAGCHYAGTVFGNVFLCGDAAGLASEATGEGIAFALISGEETAKKIIDPSCAMPEMKRIVTLKKRKDALLRLWGLFPPARFALLRMFIYLLNRTWFQPWYGI